MLSLQELHDRYRTQARWTVEVRRYLFRKLKLASAHHVLEVGCGTGVVLEQTGEQTVSKLYGLDIASSSIRLAKHCCPTSIFTCGDALNLPFRNASFDICYTHFLLLWVKYPTLALEEMRRVVSPGGYVIALAEPDYGSRIDFPPALEEPGKLQRQALASLGAEPDMGRQLASLFHKCGLNDIHTGLLGGQWSATPSTVEHTSEWLILRSDLEGLLPPSRLEELHTLDTLAWECGERILFVPTFYAWGQN